MTSDRWNTQSALTLLIVLALLNVAIWWTAGYLTGKAKYDVLLKEKGCKITCPMPATSADSPQCSSSGSSHT